MARDSRQAFYYQNKLLFRFLLLSTTAFLLLVALVWWRDRQVVSTTDTPLLPVLHFSDRAAMAEVTRQYVFGAKFIHDIESYPELKERFFSDGSLDFRDKESLKEALRAVTQAKVTLDEGAKQHVYYTSYYIGNLLVLPQVTLHEQLLAGRPNTAVLLETALADVRAGAIKIGTFYDVAPPHFYDSSLSEALFYPAPSSPSLTVSEVATVFYILAELDPARARIYEQQLADYTDQVLASGAHFASDIQAALDLVAIYHRIIVTDSNYRPYIEKARTEWVEEVDSVTRTEPITPRTFTIRDFPYPSSFFVDQIINRAYVPATPSEMVLGSLFLTLTDRRIPDAKKRLYEYDWSEGKILPIALDLGQREFPFLRDTLEQASYRDISDYLFVTSDDSGAKVVRRSGSDVWSVGDLTTDNLKDFEGRLDLGQIAFTEIMSTANLRVQLMNINETTVTTIGSIDDASSPTILDVGRLLYVDQKGSVKMYLSKDQSVHEVNGIDTEDAFLPASYRKIRFFPEVSVLAVSDIAVDPSTLVPRTKIALYRLRDQERGVVEASLAYSVVFTDAQINHVELSPGGRYLAVIATRSLGEREPKILLFDIMNGIIKKEIDISDFISSTASLDGWLIY